MNVENSGIGISGRISNMVVEISHQKSPKGTALPQTQAFPSDTTLPYY